MSHTVSGQTTNYTWDAAAGLPLVLQDGTNTYVYGLGLISATDGGGTQTYFLSDGLGSTSDLTGGSGNTVATYSYDVFGAIRSQTGSSANHWLFTGEQRDIDSGLYYLRARYYDPATGRFLARDPAGSGHPYAYAENNPVRFTDPSGMCILGLPCPKISGKQVLTAVQVGLSVSPVIGDLNDLIAVTTGYDIIWGEHISMEERALTAAGLFIGSGRMWREGAVRGVGFVDEGLDSSKAARKVHGNSFSSTKTTYLYQLRDLERNHVKFGISSNLRARYSRSEMEGWRIRVIDSGPRSEMWTAERWLSERLPGPLNNEHWKGTHFGEFPFFPMRGQ